MNAQSQPRSLSSSLSLSLFLVYLTHLSSSPRQSWILNMPNPHNLTLSKDAFSHSNESKADEYPSEVKLVICGSAGVKAIDSLAIGWKEDGFGKTKGKTTLTGIIYEVGHGETADSAMEQFSVAHKVGGVATTLIHPLPKGVSGGFPPKDTAPPQVHINYSLPTIHKAEEIQGANEEKWLAFLKEASERSLTVELGIGGDESVREAVEKLLGKAWDEEAERCKKEDKDVNTVGARIIFDNLASPPLATSSSELTRSKDLENWSEFVRVSIEASILGRQQSDPFTLTSALLCTLESF
jgi:hypothetical protein